MTKKPSHRLVHIADKEYRDQHGKTQTKTTYTELAVVWPTEKGGLSVYLPDGITVSGRLLIQPIAERSPAAEAAPFEEAQ